MTAEMYQGHPYILDDSAEMTERWRDSIILVNYEGSVKPMNVYGFSKVRGNYTATGLLYLSENKTLEHACSIDDLDFSKPAGSLVNIRKSAVFISYKPTRQWKRGYRGANMNMVRPFQEEENAALLGVSPRLLSSRELTYNFLVPSYPSVQEAIESVRSFECLARAFNSKFAIGIKRGYIHPRVFYKYMNIGKLNPDNSVTLRPQAAHVYEELSQYLNCNK